MQKSSKQYESLKKNLNHLLREFERNREWADIGNWLYRLQQTLGDKKFVELPQQVTLAKRLAQCLNVSLPAGVHSTALGVYNTILQNFSDKSELLPLMSIGLFPFFEYSSSQLKLELIKIFDLHFTNSYQCLQLIVSLMNALLTGLNENNDQLIKKIYTLLDKISYRYGRQWVDGAVWVNILKSNKVRIPGFKYFMKSFKDRDKLKKSEKQISKMDNQENDAAEIEEFEENQLIILHRLMELKELDETDDHHVRFPNFSSLVVNALCSCLDMQTQSLIKRSALDLMIFYLKLENQAFISEKDGIHLVSMMIQILKNKEYSLTRRVYTYLFGPPNMQGQYQIHEEEKQYEINILKLALKYLFRLDQTNKVQQVSYETNLLILETMIKDIAKLAKILLPSLAYDLLNYIQKGKISGKKVSDFNLKIIQPHSEIFVKAVLQKILAEETIKRESVTHEVLVTLEYYFKSRQSGNNKQIEEAERIEKFNDIILIVVEGLLKYLTESQCRQEKCAVEALDLCYQISKNLKIKFTEKSFDLLNALIKYKPQNIIYARLLTLHPHPQKQVLLPYINESSLSIVCLKNLLQLQPQSMEEEEKKAIFFALFKLLDCHLWEDTGVDLIKIYRTKYTEYFDQLIDQVEPHEWLIYWKKLNGQVEGGVLRMLKNMQNQNPINRQLSKKWLENSKQIISRIVDPVYKWMESTRRNPEETFILFRIIENIFLVQKSDFVTYFYLQRDRYFMPLIDHIFNYIDLQNHQFTIKSIGMLQFLLLQAITPQQKLNFLNVTLERTVKMLEVFIGEEGYLLEIQVLSYLRVLAQSFLSLKNNLIFIDQLKKTLVLSDLYTVVVRGMKQTPVSYVRTLYIDYLQQSCEHLVSVVEDNQFVGEIITNVLEKLFNMLRQNDINTLEAIIRGKTQDNRRRKSSDTMQIHRVQNTEFNIEGKYAQIIQLWNSVKFYIKISIENQIQHMPIVQLLSLILQSFPFSYLQYQQMNPQFTTSQYEILQEEIRNVTGLKKEVLEIFDALWENYQQKIIDFLIEKGDPRVLIHANINPNAVIKAICKSSASKAIAKYYRTSKISLPKATLHYNTEILILENQLNYFLYLYTLYCNLGLIKNKKVGSFVQGLLQLLKNLKTSSHIQTKLWILETLYALSERISFKDLHTESNKLRPQYQELVKDLLQEMTLIVMKSKNFTHRFEIKTGLFSIFSKEEKDESSMYDFIKIFPPTLHHMHQKYHESTKARTNESIISAEYYIEYFLFKQWLNRSEGDFIKYLSIVTIKTMTQISLRLLMNIYEKDLNKIALIMKDILMQMLSLCEDKSSENQIYLENVAQYIYTLFQSHGLKQEILKMIRRNILDIFMGNDFFKCTKTTLTHWKTIIDCCTQNHDLLGEFLSKEGLFEGLFTTFTRKAEATRLKIKSFERICFVIYSGRTDKYENKLRTVMQSLNQVMKEQKPSPALLILILFCIRILFIRLSQTSLNRMFRSIWPGLITLLYDIFTKQHLCKNTNLLLAGLKVIQMVHALELQEFNLHKWLFIFDYFGIRIDSLSEEEEKNWKKKEILSPFEFKPLLSGVLPEHPFKCAFIPDVFPIDSHNLNKRKLIVKEASVDSEEELRNHTFMLLQYLMDLNQQRVSFVRKDIENLIEADFISLDDYIFELK